jgi:prepilin-type N-terminal cleavage/methylation domain-containing protein
VTRPILKVRFRKDERGFTLPEMLVSIVIMTFVFFGLYNIFEMSLRVFAFGNNEVEAMENARLGVEKMEREIRGAYKYDSSLSQNHLFFTTDSPADPLTVTDSTPSELTFGNDMGGEGAGNGKIECGTPPCEYITYKLTDSAGTTPCTAAPCTLRRVNTANSDDLGDPVVENVVADGLTFTLLQSDGATLATNEGEIGMVLVSLDVAVSGWDMGTNTEGTQKLTTAIDLRNR